VKGHLSAQSVSNHFQDTFQITHDVIIPEPQNSIIMLAQPLAAHRIALAASVLTAVDFHDQPSLTADEINNITTDRLLPHELETADRTRPQPVPKPQFSAR
jgi:hypothetical protein